MNNSFLKFVIFGLSLLAFFNVGKSMPKDNLNQKNDFNSVKEKQEVKLYKLGIGDKLRVDINLIIQGLNLTILPDGTINLPRVGSIYIKDLTINETRDLIIKEYSSILRNPEVFVDLTSSRPILISISGEVQKPGIYSLSLNRVNKISNSDDGEASIVSSNGWPTIIDAIQKAGGLTSNADIRSIKVRKFTKGSIASTRNVNLSKLFEGINTERLEPIFDGDSINISKAEGFSTENSFKLSRSNIAPSKITVNVIGEVKVPGSHTIQSNSSISQAIFAAGGFNRRANTRVKLIRLRNNGTIFEKNIKFKIDGEISETIYPALKDRDTIFVSRNLWSKTNDTLQDAVKPINPIVNSYSLYKILSND